MKYIILILMLIFLWTAFGPETDYLLDTVTARECIGSGGTVQELGQNKYCLLRDLTFNVKG
jgi:hypothetical protein